MKIGISSWSIRSLLSERSLRDAINMVKEKFGIKYWEGCMSHFPIKKVPQNYLETGLINIVGSIKLSDNISGNFASSDQKLRAESISMAKEWIQFAAGIDGCTGVKINPGKGDSLFHATESYLTLSDYANQFGLKILVENSKNNSKAPNINIKVFI